MYKSLYPSVMLEFNVSPSTQIGRVTVDHQVHDRENVYKVEEEKYSRGGEFIDNFVSDNIIEFSKRWLHLAGFKEMLEDINEYYNQFGIGSYRDMYYSNSPIVPTLNGNTGVNLVDGEVSDAIVFFDQYVRPINMTFDNIQKGLVS